MLANVHSINTSQFKATTRQPPCSTAHWLLSIKRWNFIKLLPSTFLFAIWSQFTVSLWLVWMLGAHTAPVTSSAQVFMGLWSDSDLSQQFASAQCYSWRLPPVITSNWLHTWLLNTNRLTQSWSLSVWVFQGIFIVSLMEAVCDGARKWLAAPPIVSSLSSQSRPRFLSSRCIEQSVGSSRPSPRPLIRSPPLCRLCISEKQHILFHPKDATLNQRHDFFSNCWHKDKHLLPNNYLKAFLKHIFSLLSLLSSLWQCSNVKPRVPGVRWALVTGGAWQPHVKTQHHHLTPAGPQIASSLSTHQPPGMVQPSLSLSLSEPQSRLLWQVISLSLF